MDIPNTNVASSVASQSAGTTRSSNAPLATPTAASGDQEPDTLELESAEAVVNEKQSNGEQFADRGNAGNQAQNESVSSVDIDAVDFSRGEGGVDLLG